jgi:flagellar biogenesis protein FliO
MHYSRSAPKARRGITVLSLLLLIIGLVIVAIFLLRYLRSGPAVSMTPRAVILDDVILSEAKDLPGKFRMGQTRSFASLRMTSDA